LQGDASKAYKVLGWKPKVKLQELVRSMVKADMEGLRNAIGLSDLHSGA
jgi:GDPmannose 4,6-dehydratase